MFFEEAFTLAKEWKSIARVQFRDSCYIIVRYPDTANNIDNTLPYLQMIKWDIKFPVDLSCESLFADDWYIK